MRKFLIKLFGNYLFAASNRDALTRFEAACSGFRTGLRRNLNEWLGYLFGLYIFLFLFVNPVFHIEFIRRLYISKKNFNGILYLTICKSVILCYYVFLILLYFVIVYFIYGLILG